MLTLFSIPKPFRGHIEVIQRNAIASWKLLHPDIEIILIGQEEGTSKVAAEFSCRHISEVPHNSYGTPLVSGIFATAEQKASFQKMVYVNSDIILMTDLMSAVKALPPRPAVLCGRRWDLDVSEPINFGRPDWSASLRRHAGSEGKPHALTGIDYFIFDKGIFNPLPDFAIGRFYWDMWLLYQARRNGADLIDCSDDVLAIHQNHNYGHIQDLPTGCSVGSGQESFDNRLLVKSLLFSLGDANKRMRKGKIRNNLSLQLSCIANKFAFFCEQYFSNTLVESLSVRMARSFWDRNWRKRFRKLLIQT